jgi:hypothetical protein
MNTKANKLVTTTLHEPTTRIRCTTPNKTQNIILPSSSYTYFGRNNDRHTIKANKADLDQAHAQLQHNGYQTIIKALTDNTVTLSYHCMPNDQTSTRYPQSNESRPLYTEKQLRNAVRQDNLQRLKNGLTEMIIASPNKDRYKPKRRVEIGFSDEAIYKKHKVLRHSTPRTSTLVTHQPPEHPDIATSHVDIPINPSQYNR